MLVSYLKSYKSNIFSDQYKCPQSEEEISAYINILLPIFALTNELQGTTSNITVLLPSLLGALHSLKNFKLSDENQCELRNNLVHFIQLKFDFELKSNVYAASSLLNFEALQMWKHLPFCQALLKQGKEALPEVLSIFSDAQRAVPDPNPVHENETPAMSSVAVCSYFHKLFKTTSVVVFSIIQ